MSNELTEDERRAVVESGPVYLHNGLRASLAGIKNPNYCGVTSADPGFWACTWQCASELVQRPDRRFARFELHKVGDAWLGCLPAPRADWQTEDDYAAAVLRGDAR